MSNWFRQYRRIGAALVSCNRDNTLLNSMINCLDNGVHFIIAQEIQPSGKLADLIPSVVNNLIDANHLAICSPIYPALSSKRLNSISRYRNTKFANSKEDLLNSLEMRKNQEKLPEKKAFWELIRIVFTEQPKSFVDVIRFAAIKIMVITGLRIGEAVNLPLDWKRTKEYYDTSGVPAGKLGGYSKALMLRHFAEKQQIGDSVELYENTQYVPRIFETILSETLEEIAFITQPLRETLKLQCEWNRLLPWYQPTDLIAVTELYTRLSGNSVWLNISEETANLYNTNYHNSYNPQILHQLFDYQANAYKNGNIRKLNMAMYVFFRDLVNSASNHFKSIHLRTASGTIVQSKRYKWNELYLHIGELESFLKTNLPTKLPDMRSIKLANGSMLQPWEFMFLTPKRALAEERNDGIIDITRYYSVGVPEPTLLATALGEKKEKHESLFERYGTTDDDKSLTLLSHSLRHLQNTELFRVGVADTLITKRFNRHSVTQSYVYDHRSLAESLDHIELPNELEAFLGEKAATVAKLIQAELASGPIVNSFKTIQAHYGSDAAFEPTFRTPVTRN